MTLTKSLVFMLTGILLTGFAAVTAVAQPSLNKIAVLGAMEYAPGWERQSPSYLRNISMDREDLSDVKEFGAQYRLSNYDGIVDDNIEQPKTEGMRMNKVIGVGGMPYCDTNCLK